METFESPVTGGKARVTVFQAATPVEGRCLEFAARLAYV